MPMPWKKSKSGRISRFVSDLQQSPKHGGSLVVETGFPTSLIDLFVKNRDRLKKSSSSRRNKAQNQTSGSSHHPRRRVSASCPPSPPSSLHRPISLPQKLDASITEEPAAKKIDESIVGGGGSGGGVENRNDGVDGDGGRGEGGGGGCCVLMVVAVKVFLVAVLALSTKKLAVGITLSAFALLFLEFAVARVFTRFNLCPDAQIRIDSLIAKLIGNKKRKENPEEESSSSSINKVYFEIVEESRDWSEEIQVPPLEKDLDKAKSPVAEEKQVQTIRDVVFNKIEKSKSSRLKSKIVKKIVPKKLRSYKKKKKMKKKQEQEEDEVEIIVEEEEEGGGSVTELSSLYSESEISERDDMYSNPPLLESCEEINEEEEEGDTRSKGDLTKAIGLIVIVLAGLLNGKILAIGLTLSWCLILKAFCCKSQTSL